LPSAPPLAHTPPPPGPSIPCKPNVPANVPAGKKKSIADYAIVRRIHFIFERAVRRFRSDLSLWTAWLEFCRASNSHRRLGRVVGRALQVIVCFEGLQSRSAGLLLTFVQQQAPGARGGACTAGNSRQPSAHNRSNNS
jgi:hypothetical protein